MANLIRYYNKAKMVEAWIEIMLAEGYGDADTKDKDWEHDISSTPWTNGREKGFCFHAHANSRIYCFVAEHRNTDALTITVGSMPDWDCITEEEYEARIFLKPDEYELCAMKVMKLCGVYAEENDEYLSTIDGVRIDKLEYEDRGDDEDPLD
mgnify:CR=1 FL=1